MEEKVLFLIAGYPGAGKSTLLARAGRDGHPIFGTEYSGLYAELARNHLFSGRRRFSNLNDLSLLDSTPSLPRALVMEVDLVSIFSVLQRDRVDADIAPMEGLFPSRRSPERLINLEHNMLVMQSVLSIGLFRRFDVVVVNTLYAPWQVCARQWHEREMQHDGIGSPMAKLRHELFFNPANATVCSAVHRAIYDAWLESLRILRPRLCLVSWVIEGRLMLDEILPS